MAKIKSEDYSEPTVHHPLLCRRYSGISFGRCQAERGAWVLPWVLWERSSFVLVTARKLWVTGRAEGRGPFPPLSSGSLCERGSKRCFDPFELCAEAPHFPGSVYSFHQTLKSNDHLSSQMLEAIRQWKNVDILQESYLA